MRRVRNSRPNYNSSAISSNSRTVNQPTNPSTNNRAACVDCRTQYPDAARRRGIAGRVEVAVDTDAQGNVINVRLTRSSGNRELYQVRLIGYKKSLRAQRSGAKQSQASAIASLRSQLTSNQPDMILDAETLRQARNWKLKPESDGIQGVSVATEYAIRGTCRQPLQGSQKSRIQKSKLQ